MRAADQAIQRPPHARLLTIDCRGRIRHRPRAALATLVEPGDCVIANDAATLPASLAAIHARTGAALDVRLAARASLEPGALAQCAAIVFSAGDPHEAVERRAPPPALMPGDVLRFGAWRARVTARLGHPRFVSLRFDGDAAQVWRAIAGHGRPIQYEYLRDPLALWDVWSPIAAQPAAFEAPSASFALDWRMLDALRARHATFATLTHAAGLSTTGDPALDARLPFDEPYRIPAATASAIVRAKARGARVIAIGTSVVRALEHAAAEDGIVRAGTGVATQRIGPATRLAVVDALLTGAHEPDTSHYTLLRAFTDAVTLSHASAELDGRGYRTHEFGDSIWVERRQAGAARSDPARVGCTRNAA